MEPQLPTWDILDAFFMQSGGSDCTNSIVRHQIESFNEFIDKQLIQIIQGFNSIQVCHNYSPELSNFKYKIYINVLHPSLAKPVYQTTDGTQMLMTPHLARMNNLTYSSNLYVDVHVITDVINDDNVIERKETTLKGVCIGKIPIMIHSKACILSQMPGIAEGEGKNECRYDYGGYFIINGNEKVVISQDRISENKTLVFAPNGNGDGLYAEIRSMPDGMFLPPKTTSLHLSGKSNHMGNVIKLSASFLRSEVPLFVMFRALGIESDKEIYAHIVLDIDSPKHQRMITQLAACAEDACDVHTQDDALLCLLKVLGTTGTPKEFLEQQKRALEILKNTIRNDFLSHVGHSYKKKALYLGSMVRKLISIHLGYLDFDNRDSYLHKRIDTPGILFSNLFRQCYGKLIKEVRNLVVRELNLWRANTNMPLQIINQNNVHRFFKQTLIETGLRYALSTGNWGVKSIGSFQNIRQGVAQVLNRMSYLSTLSHLRRINTPMEKNGKLVQPRKLENSQYGMICPSETPEGAAVGLVKNIALSTHVTVNVSSAFVRETLKELGTHLYGDHVKDTISFLKRMGSDDAVHIMINGDIIGFHLEPEILYKELKHLKRYGSIPPTTSIIWNVQKGIITMSTEAGRMLRPLYIVDGIMSNNKVFPQIRLFNMLREKNITWKQFYSNCSSFQAFVAPLVDEMNEGFIEYMDVDEIDKAMVAMFPTDLKRIVKGTTLPPRFTHCEIEPSLLNGVLAANIPFMDHNQAPRNCYQCLWVEEPVYMQNGTSKAIKNIEVGDDVLCFNTKTGLLENTKVIHQYVRMTDKPIKQITVMSGRRIIATHDHKFMTNKGWMCQIDFTDNTVTESLKFMIHPYPRAYPHNVTIESFPRMTRSMLYNSIEDKVNAYGIGIDQLTYTHPKLPVIARLAGYLYTCNPLRFLSTYDEERFNNDVKSLGFLGHNDPVFTVYMMTLNVYKMFPVWITKGTLLVQREYINGSIGGMAAFGTKLSEDRVKNIQELMTKSFGYNQTSMSKRDFMDTFAYAYCQEKHMTEARDAEYECYIQYMKQSNSRIPVMSKDIWNLVVEIRGDMLMMPYYDVKDVNSVMISDITVESDHHSFIGGDGFAVSNSAMGKQAVGIYMSNFNHRIDTMAHVLHYPQKPLVRTKLSKYTNSISLPSGINAVVAIMTYTGFNQEDSVMINKSAIDRGLLTSTYFKSYRDQCSKNHSTGEEEIFTKPIVESSASGKMKPFNYEKLGQDGFVPKNVYIDSNDIIVGKIMPHKNQGVVVERDTSLQVKGNDEGNIDMNYQGINGDGYKFCKIRLRKYRKPQIGDKVASRSAQKGTIGMTYLHQDMPFTKSGIVPDIIMNPHAVPSRMTIGQLMECIMGKAACHIGSLGDATPFTDCSVDSISNILAKSGYEKYGNEILYNGRTGEQLQTEIFIGPTYYQRLKHMVADKSHCLTLDHEVLTANGWKFFHDITKEDFIATLKDEELVYDNPIALLHFPEYEGKMYHISNQAIDLDVTDNHRMWVSSRTHVRFAPGKYQDKWAEYNLELAKDIIGKRVRYQKNAEWNSEDYQFILPGVKTQMLSFDDTSVNMEAWLTFFGIWLAEGYVSNKTNSIGIACHKTRVQKALEKVMPDIGLKYKMNKDFNCKFSNAQINFYLRQFGKSIHKFLPDWTWKLSRTQCLTLLEGLMLGDGHKTNSHQHYYTSSKKLANDVQRLCLHAGLSGDIMKRYDAGHTTVTKDGRTITATEDSLVVHIHKTRVNPTVNHGHTHEQNIQKEYMYDFKGPVFCLQVPSEVFMVRKNGKSVWTGNSRGSNGPIVLLTRQPAEGRARNGGLRFGEMERDAIVAHGASAFLKERMLDVSDNFRVFTCRKCGLICTANPDKNIYKCSNCKNNADITQIRIPYAMKLLMQELMSMGVAPRITV
jgi:DNA-directed RNA polymerase beta subunit